MDYIAFKSLHRLLQSGIQEYIINEREINDGNNGLEFYMRNGWITTEIHLACALGYFAGVSYLDITLSHGIGKTDLYQSIWAVVHATNACTTLQFSFRQHQLNVNPLPVKSLTEAKQDSVIVLLVSMGCWCGQKNHLKSSVWKSVSMMGNFTVEGKANLVLTYKLFAMLDVGLHIYRCSTLLQLPTT